MSRRLSEQSIFESPVVTVVVDRVLECGWFVIGKSAMYYALSMSIQVK